MRRPDIILLVLDTQRAGRLGCYGYGRPLTPQLDALAERGRRYANAISPAGWTVPAHASLFTGLYPAEHATVQMDSRLPAGALTLAERLQQAGYHTAGFSHNPLVGALANGLARGFAEFHNYAHLGADMLALSHALPTAEMRLWPRLKRAGRGLLAEALGYSDAAALGRLAPLIQPLWSAGLGLAGRGKSRQT
ncbi:MAG: sulfatase-like hydrolase/transferase, partial [Candidatus Promineifilaceae bacterium]